MKISYRWLQDYIHLSEPPAVLAERLTMAGLEVEHLGPPAHLEDKGLVLGTIQRISACPGKTQRKTAHVSVGQKQPLEIVSTSGSLAPGRRVIVAQVGARLHSYGGEILHIQTQYFGTQCSRGMLCSAYELGLGPEAEELLYIHTKLPDGASALSVLSDETDCVFEIALTPNRGDATSHYGVARELSLLLGPKLRYPAGLNLVPASKKDTAACIQITDLQACPRYAALRLSQVQVMPSPLWLQQRLRAIGLLPINNVVDISNYVSHAVGQPLHTFDQKQIIGDKIWIQPAEKVFSFSSLDGNKQKIQPGDLLICDAKGPLALAGIIGGQRSSISQSTTEIFLESAYFSATNIAKTARRLGLQTEAAFRYARGIDPDKVYMALCWAAKLLKTYAKALPHSHAYDLYPVPVPKAKTWCRLPRLKQLSGTTIAKKEVLRILKSLEIQVLQDQGKRLALSIPPYRSDVHREADVFEEILRIYGYDKLQGPLQLRYKPQRHLSSLPQRAETAACQLLIAEGFLEIITHALLSEASAAPIKNHASYPKSQRAYIMEGTQHSTRYLRPSLLPSGLEVISYNLRHRQENLRLFELGTAYWRNKDSSYSEEKRLAFYMCGDHSEQPWRNNEPLNFYDISAILRRLFTRLGLHNLQNSPTKSPWFDTGLDWYANKQLIASTGHLKKKYTHTNTYAAELYWTPICKILAQHPPLRYHPIPKSPQVQRDLSLILNKKLPYAQIEQTLANFNNTLIQKVRLKSIYEGPPLPKDKKSYALSFVLQGTDTLKEAQITHTMQDLIQYFKKQLNATLRS